MSERKHTPGPWTANKYGSVHGPITRKMTFGAGTNIFDSGHWCGGTTNPEDAPLIAAAPDLLAALEAVVAISDRNHEAWDKARAAIAKATSPPPAA